MFRKLRCAQFAVLFASLCLAPTWCAAQWVTSGTNIYNSNTGNVGIGTSTPVARLHISSSTGLASTELSGHGDGTNYAGFSLFNLNNNTQWWFAYQQASQTNAFTVNYYNGTAWSQPFTVMPSGKVGIDTMNPQYQLSVNGTIQAKEVLVNTGWADYVFQSDYRIRPLTEVKSFIKENHHLPDIPSEEEIKEKGVNLGDMQAKLLAKIEELTLQMIQLNETNTALEKRVAQLEGR